MATNSDVVVTIKVKTGSSPQEVLALARDAGVLNTNFERLRTSSGSAGVGIKGLSAGVLIGNASFALLRQSVYLLKSGLNDFVGAVRSAIAAASEQQKVNALLDQIIQNTGQSASGLSKQVGDLASKYQLLTGVSDALITKSAAQLISYGATGKTIDKLVLSALNLSTVLDKDLGAAVSAINKGLQGNFAAFSKMGFAAGETGTAAQKLEVILGKVNARLKDAAIASVNNYTGQMGILGEVLGELSEKFGNAVVENGNFLVALKAGNLAINDFTTKVGDSAISLEQLANKGLQAFATILPFLIEKISKLAIAILDLAKSGVTLAQNFSGVIEFFGGIGKATTAAVGFFGLYKLATVGVTIAQAALAASAFTLRAALAATPVGALVTGLTLVAAAALNATGYLDTFVKWLGLAGDEADPTQQALTGLKGTFEDLTPEALRLAAGLKEVVDQSVGLNEDLLKLIKEFNAQKTNLAGLEFFKDIFKQSTIDAEKAKLQQIIDKIEELQNKGGLLKGFKFSPLLKSLADESGIPGFDTPSEGQPGKPVVLGGEGAKNSSLDTLREETRALIEENRVRQEGINISRDVALTDALVKEQKDKIKTGSAEAAHAYLVENTALIALKETETALKKVQDTFDEDELKIKQLELQTAAYAKLGIVFDAALELKVLEEVLDEKALLTKAGIVGALEQEIFLKHKETLERERSVNAIIKETSLNDNNAAKSLERSQSELALLAKVRAGKLSIKQADDALLIADKVLAHQTEASALAEVTALRAVSDEREKLAATEIDVAKSIQTVFDGLIEGILAGTQSAKSAMSLLRDAGKALLGDMFKKILIDKVGFDQKFQANFVKDLPGFASQGAGLIGGAFNKIFGDVADNSQSVVDKVGSDFEGIDLSGLNATRELVFGKEFINPELSPDFVGPPTPAIGNPQAGGAGASTAGLGTVLALAGGFGALSGSLFEAAFSERFRGESKQVAQLSGGILAAGVGGGILIGGGLGALGIIGGGTVAAGAGTAAVGGAAVGGAAAGGVAGGALGGATVGAAVGGIIAIVLVILAIIGIAIAKALGAFEGPTGGTRVRASFEHFLENGGDNAIPFLSGNSINRDLGQDFARGYSDNAELHGRQSRKRGDPGYRTFNPVPRELEVDIFGPDATELGVNPRFKPTHTDEADAKNKRRGNSLFAEGLDDFNQRAAAEIGLSEIQLKKATALATAFRALAGAGKGIGFHEPTRSVALLAVLLGNMAEKGLDATEAMAAVAKGIDNLGGGQEVVKELNDFFTSSFNDISIEGYRDTIEGLAGVMFKDLPLGVRAADVAIEALNANIDVAGNQGIVTFNEMKDRIQDLSLAAGLMVPAFQHAASAAFELASATQDVSDLPDVTPDFFPKTNSDTGDAFFTELKGNLASAVLTAITDAFIQAAVQASILEPFIHTLVDTASKLGTGELTLAEAKAIIGEASTAALGSLNQLKPFLNDILSIGSDVAAMFLDVGDNVGLLAQQIARLEDAAHLFDFNLQVRIDSLRGGGGTASTLRAELPRLKADFDSIKEEFFSGGDDPIFSHNSDTGKNTPLNAVAKFSPTERLNALAELQANVEHQLDLQVRAYQAELEFEVKGHNENITRLQKEKEGIQDTADAAIKLRQDELDLIKDQIELAAKWQSVVENLSQTIFNLETGAESNLNPIGRLSFAKDEFTRQTAIFRNKDLSVDQRVAAAQKLGELGPQIIQLLSGAGISQSSEAYALQFDEIIASLDEANRFAAAEINKITGGLSIEELQAKANILDEEIKGIQEHARDTLDAIDDKIKIEQDAIVAAQDRTTEQIRLVNGKAAEQLEWIRNQGNSIFKQRIDGLKEKLAKLGIDSSSVNLEDLTFDSYSELVKIRMILDEAGIFVDDTKGGGGPGSGGPGSGGPGSGPPGGGEAEDHAGKFLITGLGKYGLTTGGQQAIGQAIGTYSPGGVVQLQLDSLKGLSQVQLANIAREDKGAQGSLGQLIDTVYTLFPETKNSIDQFREVLRSIVAKIKEPDKAQDVLGFASGGTVSRDQVVRVGEGNNPELIIPLDPRRRSKETQRVFDDMVKKESTGYATGGVVGDNLTAVYSGSKCIRNCPAPVKDKPPLEVPKGGTDFIDPAIADFIMPLVTDRLKKYWYSYGLKNSWAEFVNTTDPSSWLGIAAGFLDHFVGFGPIALEGAIGISDLIRFGINAISGFASGSGLSLGNPLLGMLMDPTGTGFQTIGEGLIQLLGLNTPDIRKSWKLNPLSKVAAYVRKGPTGDSHDKRDLIAGFNAPFAPSHTKAGSKFPDIANIFTSQTVLEGAKRLKDISQPFNHEGRGIPNAFAFRHGDGTFVRWPTTAFGGQEIFLAGTGKSGIHLPKFKFGHYQSLREDLDKRFRDPEEFSYENVLARSMLARVVGSPKKLDAFRWGSGELGLTPEKSIELAERLKLEERDGDFVSKLTQLLSISKGLKIADPYTATQRVGAALRGTPLPPPPDSDIKGLREAADAKGLRQALDEILSYFPDADGSLLNASKAIHGVRTQIKRPGRLNRVLGFGFGIPQVAKEKAFDDLALNFPKARTPSELQIVAKALSDKFLQPSKFNPIFGYARGGLALKAQYARIAEKGPEVLAPLADLPGIFGKALKKNKASERVFKNNDRDCDCKGGSSNKGGHVTIENLTLNHEANAQVAVTTSAIGADLAGAKPALRAWLMSALDDSAIKTKLRKAVLEGLQNVARKK